MQSKSNLCRDPVPAADAGAVNLAHAAAAIRGGILAHLAAHGRPCDVAELSEALHAAPAFVESIVAGLEGDGHLVRDIAGWRLTEQPA